MKILTAIAAAISLIFASPALAQSNQRVLQLGTNGQPMGSDVQKFIGCHNILNYGGDNTGVADNGAALTAAEALAPNGDVCVYFPAGKYKFTAAQTFTFSTAAGSTQSLAIEGDGADVTMLDFASGANGLNLQLETNFQSYHLRGLTIATGGASTTTVGLNVNQNATPGTAANTPPNALTDVTIRGDDGYNATNYWGIGAQYTGISNINWEHVFIGGSSGGAAYASNGYCATIGGTSSVIPVVLNVEKSVFNYCNVGLNIGNYVEGITVNQSNFLGNGIGIDVPGGETGLYELSVAGTSFGTQNANIYLGSALPELSLIGDVFDTTQASQIAVSDLAGAAGSIIGNTFFTFAASSTGLSVTGYASGSLRVSGNDFYGFTVPIVLGAASQNVSVGANSYAGATTPVTNAGTNNAIETVGNQAYVAGTSMRIDRLWTDGTNPATEGGIWPSSTYAANAMSRTFTAGTVTGQGASPLTTMFTTAYNNGSPADIVSSLSDCITMVAAGVCFGGNDIARTNGAFSSKLVGREIDLEFSTGSSDAGGSAGLILNEYDIASSAPAILWGTLGSGTWANGIVGSGVTGSYFSVNSSNTTTAASFINTSSGTFSNNAIMLGSGAGQGITFGSGGSTLAGDASHDLTITLGSGGALKIGAAAGVTCSGSPTASFAVTNGIVTHC